MGKDSELWSYTYLAAMGYVLCGIGVLLLMASLSVKLTPDYYYNQLNLSEDDVQWLPYGGTIMMIGGLGTFGINRLVFRYWFFPPSK